LAAEGAETGSCAIEVAGYERVVVEEVDGDTQLSGGGGFRVEVLVGSSRSKRIAWEQQLRCGHRLILAGEGRLA